MTLDKYKPQNYDGMAALMRNLSLVERLGVFALFAANGVIFWHIPGVFGLVLGGGVFAFVALLVIGEVWRQIQIRVLGVPAMRAGENE